MVSKAHALRIEGIVCLLTVGSRRVVVIVHVYERCFGHNLMSYSCRMQRCLKKNSIGFMNKWILIHFMSQLVSQIPIHSLGFSYTD